MLKNQIWKYESDLARRHHYIDQNFMDNYWQFLLFTDHMDILWVGLSWLSITYFLWQLSSSYKIKDCVFLAPLWKFKYYLFRILHNTTVLFYYNGFPKVLHHGMFVYKHIRINRKVLNLKAGIFSPS